MTKPVGYSRNSVQRALQSHKINGRIKDWTRDVYGPGHVITVTNGDMLTTRTLHESYVFVVALASAHQAAVRQGFAELREQGAPLVRTLGEA